MDIALHPIAYDARDPRTDISYIVNSPSYNDALVLFNDNFEDRNEACRGANTAMVRPRAFDLPCRVVGVPTGWRAGDGGFQRLTDDEKDVIVAAFERVNTALHVNPALRRVVYFCSPTDRTQLGFAVFRPAPSVVTFLNARLRRIPDRFATGLPVSILALDMWEEMVEAKRARRARNLDKRQYKSWKSGGVRHSSGMLSKRR